MHILPVLAFLSLFATYGILLYAFLRAQRTTRELATQLSRAREQQHQDKQQLTERSQLDTLKDEFISTVSHELRTPLTSIRGALAVAHKLAGNLGMFGYGAAGSIASEIEHIFKDPTPESFAHLATLARQLRRTLEPHL
jgi:signal transduction histidine kinase